MRWQRVRLNFEVKSTHTLTLEFRYLEDVLVENPSYHPTIVLSQINHEELKLLVEFMYTGEVSVATDKLGRLLEAAKILKIKGLWESGPDDEDGGSNVDEADLKSEQAERYLSY